MASHEGEIRDLLKRYEASLNASDAEAAAGLYASDGVFMPQGFPTATGHTQILEAYRGIFGSIELAIAFQVDEVRVGEGLATAVTRSNGSVRARASHASMPESNRELFVFTHEAGAWHIARYMFNKAA